MAQVPVAKPVTLLPLTVQISVVVEVNITGLPDGPPVADTVPVPPTLTAGVGPKLIVWLPTPWVIVPINRFQTGW